jgi:hypothetical protein
LIEDLAKRVDSHDAVIADLVGFTVDIENAKQ